MDFDAIQIVHIAIGALLGFLAKNAWGYISHRSNQNQDDIKALRTQMHELELAMERTNTTLNIFLEEIKGLFRLKDDYKALASKIRKVESSINPES